MAFRFTGVFTNCTASGPPVGFGVINQPCFSRLALLPFVYRLISSRYTLFSLPVELVKAIISGPLLIQGVRFTESFRHSLAVGINSLVVRALRVARAPPHFLYK